LQSHTCMWGGGDGCAALSAVPGGASALLPWLMMLGAGPMLGAGLPCCRSCPTPLDRASGGVPCCVCSQVGHQSSVMILVRRAPAMQSRWPMAGCAESYFRTNDSLYSCT
jgi:hypothetical protein